MKLASRFGSVNQIRRDRPLTHDELMHYVPSVFGENKHESRSDRYTYIPTITLLDNLQRKAFSHSLRARLESETRANANILSTCYVCVAKARSLASRCLKSYCLIATTAPAHTRCCRGYSDRFARMD